MSTIIEPPDFEKIKQQRFDVQRAVNDSVDKSASKGLRQALKASAFGAGLDFLGNFGLSVLNQKHYKENQRELFKLQMQAQKDAASNEVEGLRKAGLSASMATGANGMSVAGASAVPSSMRAPSPAPEFGLTGSQKSLMAQENRLMEGELSVKRAQAELLASQKAGQDIANDNALGANYAVQTAFDSWVDGQMADAEAVEDWVTWNTLKALKDSAHPILNVGGYDVVKDLIKSSSFEANAAAERISGYLDSIVLSKQATDDVIVNSLAIAPFLHNEKMRADIGYLGQAALKLMADTENAKALLPAYKKQLDKVLADIRESGVRADEIHNSDLQTAVANGDWGRVGSIATEDAVKLGAQVFGIYMFSRGARGAARGAAAETAAPTLSRSGSAPTFNQPVTDVLVGETKKALAKDKAAAVEADRKKAYDTFDTWYKGYKSGHSQHEHNDNKKSYPKRLPKTDAFGNKIYYR